MELQLKLNQFEGPLDLLLHLLDKDKIDIKDIFVSDITEQYLKYIFNGCCALVRNQITLTSS